MQYRRKDIYCWTPPIRIWVEPTNFCNLNCVSCLRSLGREVPIGYLDMELFRKIADEASEFANDINFIGSGESLFHPELAGMVAYAKKRGLRTRLETNATILNAERSEKLIDAGLDFLSISFDGYTKEDYEAIRRGAHFETTLANVKGFLRIKKEKGNRTPYTIIQFLRTPAFLASATEEKRKEFEANFKDLPLNGYRYVTPHRYSGRMSRERIGVTHGFVRNVEGSLITKVVYVPCVYLWTSMQILWDGRAVACCMDFYGDYTIGDTRRQTLLQIWNGERLQTLRKKLKEKKHSDIGLCKECDILYQELFCGIPVKNIKDACLFLRELWSSRRA